MKRNNRLLLTGGHAATTALSIVQEIKNQKIDWDIHWVGPQKAVEGKNIASLEYKYFEKYNVIFHKIITGRIQRRFTFWTIPSLLKIPIGFVQSLFLLIKIKPFLVLSFGGYASFPVVVISKIFKIPVLIHEQTSVVGRANQVVSRFVDKILLSRKTSKKYFSKDKSILVGNPILSEYFNGNTKKSMDRKTILVIGGSRGSQPINKVIEENLRTILEKFNLIHLTGVLGFSDLEKIKSQFSDEISSKYQVISSVTPFEMLKLYKKADFVISRSGANTVSELIALKKPAIFIPIPWSYLDEQKENAKFASEYIPTMILDQNNLKGKNIIKLIESFSKSKFTFSKKESPDKESSKKVVEVIKKYSK
ncbi:glycosyltransferase [Patescibacteria group bacterium]